VDYVLDLAHFINQFFIDDIWKLNKNNCQMYTMCDKNSKTCSQSVVNIKLPTGGNDPTMTKRMRYSQYVQNTKYRRASYSQLINTYGIIPNNNSANTITADTTGFLTTGKNAAYTITTTLRNNFSIFQRKYN
jgi:hypothetical protein